MPDAPDLTQLLHEAQRGDQEARDRAFALVYEELRRSAHAQLRRLRPGATLHTTALVHEAYVKLFGAAANGVRGEAGPSTSAFQSRAHFAALSATAMRQILIDHFRRRQAEKRGGGATVVTLEAGQVPGHARGPMLLALDEALDHLARLNERQARVVTCKFYGGMTEPEVAEALGVSERTVRNDWRKARAWLLHALAEDS